MAPDDWSDARLEELARDVKGLYASYGVLMQGMARLDERADVGDRERREAREAQERFAAQFNSTLEKFDKACDLKIERLEKAMDSKRWTPTAKAAPYAAAIAGFLAVVGAWFKP